MPLAQFLVPVGDPEEAVDEDVHRGVGKPVQVDLEVVVTHRGVLENEFPHAVDEGLDLVGIGVVAERQHVFHPPELALAHVVHDRVDDLAVRDADHRVVKRPHPGRAEPDALHGPLVTVHEHPVPDLERPVADDGEGAQHVRQSVLGGEGDGEAAQPESGDEGGDRVALALGDEQEGDDDRTHPEHRARQRHEVIVHIGLGLRGDRFQLRTDRFDGPEREPHRDARQGQIQHHVQDLVHEHRKPQIGQEAAEDPDRREPGSGQGGRAQFLGGPVGAAAGQADQESAEENPQELLGNPRQDGEDREADELPERETQEGALDDRGEQIQQPAGVPGEGRFVEGPGGAHRAPRDPPGEVGAALKMEFRKPDRKGGEGGLPALGVEVLRIGRHAVHPDEQPASVEDRLELAGDESAFLGGRVLVEVESGRDGLPVDLRSQLLAEERIERGARAADILGDRRSLLGIPRRSAGEENQEGGDPPKGRLEGMTHGVRGQVAAYAWQDSNLRPTD